MTRNKTGIAALMERLHIRPLYIAIIVYVIIVSLIKPVFFTWGNWMNLLRQVAVYGIMSCGITFVMLTGRTELSAGMMISLLCEISCWFVIPSIDNQFLAIVVPIALGAVFGLLNGVLVGVIKLNSFVATLSTMSVFTGLGLLFYNSVEQLMAGDNCRVYRFIGSGTVFGITMPVIICAVVVIICHIVLKRTVFGQHIYAVGGNIVNARYSGINPTRVIVSAYVISGLLTGVASVVMTARTLGINSKMGGGYEFTCLTAIVIGGINLKGGKGSVFGSIIGVLILGIIFNSFTILGLSSSWQDVAEGIILLAAVAVQLIGVGGKK